MYVWCVVWLDGLMLGGGLVVCGGAGQGKPQLR